MIISIWGVVIGVLLFMAGVLLGYQWGTSRNVPVSAHLPAPPVVQDTVRKDTVVKPIPREPEVTGPSVKVYNYKTNSMEVLPDSLITLPLSRLQPTHCVQLGAFTNKDRANTRIGELRAKGLTAYIFEGKSQSGKQWYMVRCGLFTERRLADRMASMCEKNYKIQSIGRPYSVF
ncbi:MAG: SPOR domain-containing protein [Candidatus Kapaibacterium sp.]